MNISGWIKQSMMDFPGKIAAVVFTQGCNFKCPYCHNPELIAFETGSFSEEVIFQHFTKNRFLLDGVVITGGEPTLQPELLNFIKKIKSLGLAVKLDTNGSHPKLVKKLIGQQLVDYFAMDIKSAFDYRNYSLASGIPISETLLQNIKQTMHMIIESGIEHEFRTTICKELITFNNISSILHEIEGCKRYCLQQYRTFNNEKSEQTLFTVYDVNSIENYLQHQKLNFKVELRC